MNTIASIAIALKELLSLGGKVGNRRVAQAAISNIVRAMGSVALHRWIGTLPSEDVTGVAYDLQAALEGFGWEGPTQEIIEKRTAGAASVLAELKDVADTYASALFELMAADDRITPPFYTGNLLVAAASAAADVVDAGIVCDASVATAVAAALVADAVRVTYIGPGADVEVEYAKAVTGRLLDAAALKEIFVGTFFLPESASEARVLIHALEAIRPAGTGLKTIEPKDVLRVVLASRMAIAEEGEDEAEAIARLASGIKLFRTPDWRSKERAALWLRALYGMPADRALRAWIITHAVMKEDGLTDKLLKSFSPKGEREALKAIGNELVATVLAFVFGRQAGTVARQLSNRLGGGVAQVMRDIFFAGPKGWPGSELADLVGLLISGEISGSEAVAVAREWSESETTMGVVEFWRMKSARIFARSSAVVKKMRALGLWFKEDPGPEEVTRAWVASLATPVPFPTDKRWESEDGKLIGRFLPREDARGIFLGELTNSCQHPWGAGDSSAWHGQADPDGGFFVVEDRRGEVVAMSWTWRGKTTDGREAICFDNVEAKGLGPRNDAVAKIYQAAAQDLISEGLASTVTIGAENSDLRPMDRWESILPVDDEFAVPPRGVYSDADEEQWLIASGGKVENKPREYDTRAFVTAGGSAIPDKYAAAMEDVARACYPPEYAFVDEDADIFVLLFHGSDVVGYAAIESEAAYINDVAVLPEHRGKGSIALLEALRHVMAGVAPEGEWSADLREATSYRLLKLLERRGKVKIVEDEESEQMMDGVPMRAVRFRFA